MPRTSTTYHLPPSAHPSRCADPHPLVEPIRQPCGTLTAAQLLVYTRAAADAACSAAERAGVATALGRQLDDLLARIEQSPEAVLYARAFELLDVGACLHAATVDVDREVLATLAELSDLLLDLCTPCRSDARPRRRRGIVRTGNGFPIMRPATSAGTRVYQLLDEREHLLLPCTTYKIRDWDGLLHAVVGPVADRGEGRISRDPLRAFLGLGLAVLYRRCERLTASDREGRFADWPYPTRMPGLVAPGSKEEIVVDVVELLRLRQFGLAPGPANDDDDAGGSLPGSDAPPRPQYHVADMPAPPFVEGEFEITEVVR